MAKSGKKSKRGAAAGSSHRSGGAAATETALRRTGKAAGTAASAKPAKRAARKAPATPKPTAAKRPAAKRAAGKATSVRAKNAAKTTGKTAGKTLRKTAGKTAGKTASKTIAPKRPVTSRASASPAAAAKRRPAKKPAAPKVASPKNTVPKLAAAPSPIAPRPPILGRPATAASRRPAATARRPPHPAAANLVATKPIAAKPVALKPAPSGGDERPPSEPVARPPLPRRPVATPAPRRPVLPVATSEPPPVAGARTSPSLHVPAGVAVHGRIGPRFGEVLTVEALSFVAALHRRFEGRRRDLLAARAERQKRFDAGELPDFLPETAHIRAHPWKVAPIPPDLVDRRVEITGPPDRKMVINALNSGAKVFMADFEDANAPTFANNIVGQLNLKDRWHALAMEWTDPAAGKLYRLGNKPAVLMVRPRHWAAVERHVEIDGAKVSGALFDFGLYAFHNAAAALAKGSGPYFYLPKLESHLEARLWNDVFFYAESTLALPRGAIKATVLIETLPAAFEMHEILHEMKDHIVGLNCGRWDYIFSFIKKFARNPAFILPDRRQVVMGKAFLKAYSQLLIQTCHRRGAFAMGGMAAQIPVKDDDARNEAAFAKVRADKEREAGDGHDGTWVAHPGLVPVAMEVFDRLMPGKNQLDELREDVDVGQAQLLEVHQGTRTEEGLRENIRVCVRYLESWLLGRGAVPIYDLMEDAATAEISRAQVWQWLRYGVKLEDGTQVTPSFFEKLLHEEMDRVRGEVGEEAFEYGRFPEAIALFRRLVLATEFEEFLTTPAYALID